MTNTELFGIVLGWKHICYVLPFQIHICYSNGILKLLKSLNDMTGLKMPLFATLTESRQQMPQAAPESTGILKPRRIICFLFLVFLSELLEVDFGSANAAIVFTREPK